MKKEKQAIPLPIFSIFLLTFFLLLSNIIVKYDFDLFHYSIVASTVSFPFVYFYTNRILHKSNLKITIFSILISIIAQSSVFLITHFLTSTNLNLYECFGSLISFTITIFLNLFLYNLLLKDKFNYFRQLLIYMIVLLLDSFIYILIINKSILSGLGMVFLISNFIKLILGSFLAFLETCLK